ncbi:hypothetical protein CAPTEDRAFT_105883, partial [Capitella teleta]
KNGWCPKKSDQDSWLQVTFGDLQTIYAIETLGSVDYDEYVKMYRISYSSDGSEWNWFNADGETHTFTGNVDRLLAVRNYFEPPVEAGWLKIHPIECHDYCSMRWELYKCLNLGTSG